MPDWDSLRAEFEPIVDAYIDAHPDLVGAYATGGTSLFLAAKPAPGEATGPEPDEEDADVEAAVQEILQQFLSDMDEEEPEIMAKVSAEIAEEEPDLGLADLFAEGDDDESEKEAQEAEAKLNEALAGEFDLLDELGDGVEVEVECVPLTPEEAGAA